jgi:hypothetical protein
MSSTHPVLPAIDSQALTPQNLTTSDWALALRLLLTPGLGAQSARKLWRLCGSLPAIWAQPYDTLAQSLGEPLAKALLTAPPRMASPLPAHQCLVGICGTRHNARGVDMGQQGLSGWVLGLARCATAGICTWPVTAALGPRLGGGGQS